MRNKRMKKRIRWEEEIKKKSERGKEEKGTAEKVGKGRKRSERLFINFGKEKERNSFRNRKD